MKVNMEYQVESDETFEVFLQEGLKVCNAASVIIIIFIYGNIDINPGGLLNINTC